MTRWWPSEYEPRRPARPDAAWWRYAQHPARRAEHSAALRAMHEAALRSAARR